MALRDNASSDIPNMRTRIATLAQEMAAFDALPRQVRKLLRDMPIDMSAVQVGEQIDRHGSKAVAFALECWEDDFLALPPHERGWPSEGVA